MKSVAIILARGGSKRIPGKNIRPFLGKPVIAYSITAALSSGLFDEVMVSTDDERIAAIARQYGAKVPFMRTAANANDTATTADALIEVLAHYRVQGFTFEYACCLYPTAPFVTAGLLQEACSMLRSEGYSSVFPVMRYPYAIWRSLKTEEGQLVMNWPEYKNARSQDLPEAYHDAGQFYFFRPEALLQEGTLFTAHSGGIVIDELHGQDIDTLTDWQLAEMKYRLINTPCE